MDTLSYEYPRNIFSKLPTCTIVIPTYNRPQDIVKCLNSILYQTSLPEEVILVDDGNLPGFPLEEQLVAKGISCRFVKKERPGLTESRNKGISLAANEIIVFVDDDIILQQDALRELLAVFADDPDKHVGGACPKCVNEPPMTLGHIIRWAYDTLFLISGPQEGIVLPSGYAVDLDRTPFPLKFVSRVEHLPGGVMAYRREIFQDFLFTPHYHEYALDEDKDFSYRVSRKYTLIYTPFARAEHYPSPSMRPSERNTAKRYLIGRYLFFKNYVRKGWWSWLFFAYSSFGWLLYRLLIAVLSLKRKNWQRLQGGIDALLDILTGKTPQSQK